MDEEWKLDSEFDGLQSYDGNVYHYPMWLRFFMCLFIYLFIFVFSVVSALNKAWCVNCFACSTCNTKLTLK